MKRLGTITMYYPFIQPAVQTVLDATMAAARDYDDFVRRLGELVSHGNAPPELAYMTAVHAFRVKDLGVQEMLRNRYSGNPAVRVWTYPFTSHGDRIRYYGEFRTAFEQAAHRAQEEWVLAELHLHHAYYGGGYLPVPIQSELLQSAREILDRSPGLSCFEALALTVEGSIAAAEGNEASAVELYDRALDKADEHDDGFLRCVLMRFLSDAIKGTDTETASRFIEEGYRRSVELGGSWWSSEFTHSLALLSAIRGEYDLALHCYSGNWMEYYRKTGLDDTASLVVAMIYNDLSMGEEALEFIEYSMALMEGAGSPAVHAEKANALTILGRLDEAQTEVEVSQQKGLREGVDAYVGFYAFSLGLLEQARGNPAAALDAFQDSLVMSESVGQGLRLTNRALREMARAEAAMMRRTRVPPDTDYSGPWMQRFETHARKHKLPGIMMEAAMLRAEFLADHGRAQEAKAVLVDALDILDSPGVKTLRQRIETRLKAIPATA